MRATKPPTVGPTSHDMLPTTRRMPNPSWRCSFGRMSAIIAACAGPPTSEKRPTRAGDGEQPRESGHRAERQRAERARQQAEEDQLAAAQPVGQPAADDRPHDARERQQPEQDAGFGHADVERPRNVERKKRKDERAADLVDEVHADNDPEPRRKFVVELPETGHLPEIIAVLGSRF